MTTTAFRLPLILTCCAALLTGAGCKSTANGMAGGNVMKSMPGQPELSDTDSAQVQSDRMLVWTAELSVEAWDVGKAVAEAVAMTERAGGFVEKKSNSGESSAYLKLRVPTRALKDTVAGLETLGTVTRREIEGEDVTEDYIDTAARLKNKVVLRDRLQQLLAKATEVKDILAIETELNRVQGDIDSMEGRIKSLKGRVDYATITINLERKAVLGPLGYLCKGIAWGVGKLFYLRS